MQLNNTQREKIQICRALAIIAVVMIHNCPSGIVGVLLRPFLNFCVATFLFLSGLLTGVMLQDVIKFYRKRIFRILIPYTIWSFIYSIYFGTISEFAYNYMTGQCCNIYYYIIVYIQLTLLVPLASKMIKSKYWKLGFVITPIAIIIQYILLLLGRPLRYPWNANNFAVWFVFFYFGMCINAKKINISSYKKRKMTIALLMLLIQFIEGLLWYRFGDYNMATTQIKISSMLTSLAFASMLVVWIKDDACRIRGNVRKVMLAIGNSSFGIYMTHILVMNILNITVYQYAYPIFPIRVILIILIEIVGIGLIEKIFGKKICRCIGLQ